MRVPAGGSKRLRAIFARYNHLRPDQGRITRSAFGSGPKANTYVQRHSIANYKRNTKYIGEPTATAARIRAVMNISTNGHIARMSSKMNNLTNVKMMRKTFNRITAVKRIRTMDIR